MKMFAWFDKYKDLWFAVDTKTEKCHGGFEYELDAEKWIVKNGYELL